MVYAIVSKVHTAERESTQDVSLFPHHKYLSLLHKASFNKMHSGSRSAMEPCLSSDEGSCTGAELLAAAQEDRWVKMLGILEEDPSLIHVTDPLGETSLHSVARVGNVDTARQLAGVVGIRCLSEVLTEQNSQGNTPLRLALESCHEEMVEYLYDALILGHFSEEGDDRGCSGSHAFYSDIEIQVLNRA